MILIINSKRICYYSNLNENDWLALYLRMSQKYTDITCVKTVTTTAHN